VKEIKHSLLILLICTVLITFSTTLVLSADYCKKFSGGSVYTSPDSNAIYPLRFIEGICSSSLNNQLSDVCSDEGTHVVESVCNKTTLKCQQYEASTGLYITESVKLNGADAQGLSCNYAYPNGKKVIGKCEMIDIEGGLKAGRCCGLENSYCDETQGIGCCSGLNLNCIANKCIAENPDGVTFTSIPAPIVINGLEGTANITVVIGNTLGKTLNGKSGEFHCQKDDSTPIPFTIKLINHYYAVFDNGKTIRHECTYSSSDIPLDKDEVTASVMIDGKEYTSAIKVIKNTGLEFTVPQTVQLGVPFDAVMKSSIIDEDLYFGFEPVKAEDGSDVSGLQITPPVNGPVNKNGNTFTFTISNTESVATPLEINLSAKNTNYNLQVFSNKFTLKSCLKNATTTCSKDDDCCLFYSETGADGFNYCYVRPTCISGTCVFETYNMSMFPSDYTCKANGPCKVGATEDCHNGIDDNCNGFVDCQDPACKMAETPKEPAWWPATASRENGGLTDLQDFFLGTDDCRRSFNDAMPGCSLVECGLCVNGKKCDCNMLGYQSGDQFNWWNAVVTKNCTLVEDDYCKTLNENSQCTNKEGLCINRSVLKGGECTAEQGLKDLGITCNVNGKPDCGMACCAPQRTEGTTTCGNDGEECCPYGCNGELSCCMATTNVLLPPPYNYYEPTHGYSCKKSCSALTSAIQSITPNEDGSTTVYLTIKSGKKARLTFKDGKIIMAELDGDIWGTSPEQYKQVALDGTAYGLTNFGSDVYMLFESYLKKLSVSLPVQIFPELGCSDYDNENNCKENGKICIWNTTTSKCEPIKKVNPNGNLDYGAKCSQSVDADPSLKCNRWLGLVCMHALDNTLTCQCEAGTTYQKVNGFGSCVSNTPIEDCALKNPLGILAFENRIFVADTFNKRIVALDNETLKKTDEINKRDYTKMGGSGYDNVLVSPTGLVMMEDPACSSGTIPHLYILDPGSKIGTLAYVWTIRPDNLRFSYDLEFPSIGQRIDSPAGIAVSGGPNTGYNYEVYITSFKKITYPNGGFNYEGVVQVFNKFNKVADLTYLTAFGSGGYLAQPIGIAVLGDKVYVADSGYRNIEVFSRGSYTSAGTITIEGSKMPTGIATDGTSLYVTDSEIGNSRIYKLDASGNKLKEVPVEGRPVGITVAGGRIYVTDYARSMILVYDSDLNLLNSVSNIC